MNESDDAARRANRRQFLLGLGGAGCVTALSSRLAAFAADTGADLIIRNARVWAGLNLPAAEAIAIAGNRIVAIGSNAAVRAHKTARTREVDVQGRFIMPGFNDSHLHLTYVAAERGKVHLLGSRSIADVVGRIRQRVQQTAPGEWVVARAQWHEALLEEGRMPTRKDLDSVSPNNPVFIPRGGHVATANSKALELAGINRDTPNPPGGIIVRDANGEPTGMLLERARPLVAQLLKPLAPDRYRAQLAEQIDEYSALGITSLTNPSTLPDHVEHLAALHRTAPLKVRVQWTANVDTAAKVRDLRARYAPLQGDDILRFSGIGEPGTDGGVEGAYLREPYAVIPGEQDDPSYRGIVLPFATDRVKYAEFYHAAIDAGFNVMTHVTGDGGLDIALEVLAEVRKQKAFDHLRWTLHGCFLTDDKQLAEIRRLGLYITAQAQPYLLGVQMSKWWGRARADRSIPMRAFLDARIGTGAGSDDPAGIANPLESLGWMVNRLCLGGLQLDKKWGISPEEALHCYTRVSAETQFMESKVGVLGPGMLADIVVLQADPLRAAPEELPKIKVDATLSDGRAVFDRDKLFA